MVKAGKQREKYVKTEKDISAAQPKDGAGEPLAGDSSSSVTEASNRWTFLTNHAHVLILLSAQPELVLREVATRVGITERAVQRIVHDLEEEGLILRKRVGRRNHYEVLADQPLRHPIEAHRSVGDLLALISGKKS